MMDVSAHWVVGSSACEVRYKPENALPSNKAFYRVLHEIELGGSRRSMPEVFPFFDNHFTPLTRPFQLLHKAINPTMTGAKWRAFWDHTRAFSNNNGFGMTEPRADFVNGRDLTAEPIKQEALVCGGALLAGAMAGDWFYPEYVDGRMAAPSASYVLDRPWLWFTAVNIRADGKPGMFPDGMDGAKVLLLANRPIRISKSKVIRWTASSVPDPYRVYG